MKNALRLVSLLVLAAPGLLAQQAAPQGTASGKPSATADSKTTASSNSCLAVKPAGSHAFRNIMLAGVAGALVSKEQYKVVDVVNYPAKVGQKYHGNDLQTIQNGGTKVIILDKKDKATDQCHAHTTDKK